MKILVLHDDQGNISSVGVPGAGLGKGVHLIPPEGQKVSVVDVPELGEKALDAIDQGTDLELLADAAERWRIDTGGKVPKLVRKGAA